MRIDGGCHCGNLRFHLDWSPAPARIDARACACSFCTRHGASWVSCPTGALELDAEDRSLVRSYAFATATATFHLCARCGVVPVVTSRIDGTLYAVVNANTFTGVDPALVHRSPVQLGDETAEARLERRRRNWIARVRWRDAPDGLSFG